MVWFTDLLWLSLFCSLHNHMQPRLLKKNKSSSEIFVIEAKHLIAIYYFMICLTALAHRICVFFLFWNISFMFLKPSCAGWLRYEKRPVLVHKELCPVVNNTGCVFQNASLPAHYFTDLCRRSVSQFQIRRCLRRVCYRSHSNRPFELLIAWNISRATRSSDGHNYEFSVT